MKNTNPLSGTSFNKLNNEDVMALMANLLIDLFLKEKHIIATNSHKVYNENIPPLQ